MRVAEIASACGVSEKTVFDYFPTEQSLVLDLGEATSGALSGLGVVRFRPCLRRCGSWVSTWRRSPPGCRRRRTPGRPSGGSGGSGRWLRRRRRFRLISGR
ncbi:hypothetical protein [Umezawaea sp.]|uniref:hypothetical protein n=1 Tax=Umezawaea sp. TaxID=1955258 RepID=UPI002ED53B0B